MFWLDWHVVAPFAFERTNAAFLRVRDAGQGIPPDELPRIWERLFRGDASRAERGLGLGLSLVKAVVEAHGGTVTVEAHRRAGRVEVRVVDEGQGIPEDERERIFSKFHRGDGAPRSQSGAGLGLFIARGLVRAMGGRIWVDSAEGGGSSFAFELPLAEAVETEPEPTGV